MIWRLRCFSVNANTNTNQTSVWQDFGQNAKSIQEVLSAKNTLKKRRLLLDESLLKNHLNSVVVSGLSAKSLSTPSPSHELNFPLPNGEFVKVKAIQSKVISKAMSESYPELKTWNVVGVDNPKITGVIDFTNNGFHGMLLMPDGDTIFIDPDKELPGDVYASFSKQENSAAFN